MQLMTQMETMPGFVPMHTTKLGLCAREGCIAHATHSLRVWMPVVGGTKKRPHAETVSMIAGVRLCEYHADHLGPYDVIKREEVEAFVRRVCYARNFNFPDFDKAQLKKVKL